MITGEIGKSGDKKKEKKRRRKRNIKRIFILIQSATKKKDLVTRKLASAWDITIYILKIRVHVYQQWL